MNKQFAVLAFATLLSIASVNAQGGGQPRQTPEERTKSTMVIMDSALQLSPEVKAKTEVIIAEYNNKAQKAMEEMRASGNMDRDAMMAKRKELADARDIKLKEIFTPDQMKKWKDEVEPSLRPQRGGGQPGNK